LTDLKIFKCNFILCAVTRLPIFKLVTCKN